MILIWPAAGRLRRAGGRAAHRLDAAAFDRCADRSRLIRAPPDIAAGAQIFAQNCVRCHGAGGEGNGELVKSGQVPPPLSFTDAGDLERGYAR